MKVFRHESINVLPVPLSQAWDFFANPDNLHLLTPKEMAMSNVYSLDAQKVYPGMLIVHKVSPLPLVKLTWITEITHVHEHVRFVDEQRSGPFALWHHIHEFKECSEGTEVRDLLYYALPLGVLGRVAGTLQVHGKVRNIFKYRTERLNALFP